ncbi:hypothetical protein WOC76_07060 [Methylocystis sp. IM3]|uniref:hypothetical protein n=1 Tax=Methylocystis sp. IM3 TaxID=3136722 RepID=UPI003119D57D
MLPPITLRHIGDIERMDRWTNPPMMLPPPHAVFAAIPGAPRKDEPAVIELPSWERIDRPTR